VGTTWPRWEFNSHARGPGVRRGERLRTFEFRVDVHRHDPDPPDPRQSLKTGAVCVQGGRSLTAVPFHGRHERMLRLLLECGERWALLSPLLAHDLDPVDPDQSLKLRLDAVDLPPQPDRAQMCSDKGRCVMPGAALPRELGTLQLRGGGREQHDDPVPVDVHGGVVAGILDPDLDEVGARDSRRRQNIV
jgi:hypothetical protein